MFRFHLAISLDFDGMWIVRDTLCAVYRDSQAMSAADAVATCQWLNEAHLDGRLRRGYAQVA